MEFIRLKLVVAIVLGINVSSGVSAAPPIVDEGSSVTSVTTSELEALPKNKRNFGINLYVNTKTKQIYTEPGPDRERIGSFERVEDVPVKAATPVVLPPRNRSAELANKAETARLISKIDSLEEKAKKSEDLKVTMDKNGLQVKTADDNFNFKLGGRLQTGYTGSSGDHLFTGGGAPVEANNGTELRRARLYFAGTFYKDWYTKLQVDFADNAVGIKDMYIDYKGLGDLGLGKMAARLGNQKQAFSRELQDSSNDLMFQERSVMNALNEPVVDRAIGFNVRSSGKIDRSQWTSQAGVYGEPLSPNKTSQDEGWGTSGRFTFAPIAEKDKLIHLGIAGNYRKPSDAGHVAGVGPGVHYRYETAHNTDLYVVDAGVITSVNNIKMIGLEANGVYGPFSVGGEYTHSWMDRNMGLSSLSFNGWYGEASWSLTGESRSYKEGKFKRLQPARDFSLKNLSDGGIGAWELALRVAGVNMNDGAFRGGEMKNFTAALNWYLNPSLRFMFGYDRILEIKNSPLYAANGGKPDGLNTFMFRSQIAF